MLSMQLAPCSLPRWTVGADLVDQVHASHGGAAAATGKVVAVLQTPGRSRVIALRADGGPSGLQKSTTCLPAQLALWVCVAAWYCFAGMFARRPRLSILQQCLA